MAERVGISPVMETANAESASERAPRTERANRGVDRFLRLQQAIGNRATQSLLAGGLLQPKLRIGPVDDVYEREADRTADRVMRMPVPDSDVARPLQAPISRVQRMCPECEEEDEKVRRQVQDEEEEVVEKEDDESLLRKAKASAAPPVDAGIESHITSLRGGGRPLSPSVRSFFEPRFGHDFSAVRLHTDATARGAANAINARAFTIGSDIVFNAGEYSDHSTNGRQLLGHELTHVIQQRKTPRVIQRAAPVAAAAGAGAIVIGEITLASVLFAIAFVVSAILAAYLLIRAYEFAKASGYGVDAAFNAVMNAMSAIVAEAERIVDFINRVIAGVRRLANPDPDCLAAIADLERRLGVLVLLIARLKAEQAREIPRVSELKALISQIRAQYPGLQDAVRRVFTACTT